MRRNGAEAERGMNVSFGEKATVKKYPSPNAFARSPKYAVIPAKTLPRSMQIDMIRPEIVTRIKAQNTPVPKVMGLLVVINACPADNRIALSASVVAAQY